MKTEKHNLDKFKLPLKISKEYKYSTDKRHQKLREYYQQKHETWLQENPEFQKIKQLKLTI